MLMKDYIELGSKKAGSLTALGLMLGMSQPRMSHVKAGKEKLPAAAMVQLADYIDADLHAVIAANELVTEKDEAKIEFWRPFVSLAKAATILVSLGVVTNFVTPSPAEASTYNKSQDMKFVLCKLMRKIRGMIREWLSASLAHVCPDDRQPNGAF